MLCAVGDRTPKQKMKIKVSEQRYLDYFHSYSKSPYKDLKVKSRSALVRFLEITREIIAEGEQEAKKKILQGSLLDIAREGGKDKKNDLLRQLKQIRDVLERWEISGFNRKLQMKPQKWSDEDSQHGDISVIVPGGDGVTAAATNVTDASSGKGEQVKATEVLLILKWGGDLTPLGRKQAEHLGAQFRHCMYPAGDGSAGGVLRLHATYRHDLKIKASDEGRVMKTAAAFTKGLLELEGNLTPILASLVTVEEKNRQMLDKGGNNEIKDDMDRCKEQLNLLQVDQDITEELVEKVQ